MRAPREVAYKWLGYGLCIFFLLFLRLLLLGRVTVWGVIPFLPPLILACVSSLEEPRPAVIFGCVFGVLCDLLFAAPFPCLFTLAFTISALLITVISHRFLQGSFFCSAVSAVLAFFIIALLNGIVLGARGHADFPAMLSVFARETLISMVLLPLCYLPLRRLHRFFTV